MKKSIFFWGIMTLILAVSSCKKEEVLETAIQQESTIEPLTTSDFRGAPLGTAAVLRPYVVSTGLCYGFRHTGNSYETLVYVTGAKPYDRRVIVFGWRNGNMSSIPNTYTITVPANSTTSSRVNTFPDATMLYSSIKVEVSQVLKRTSSGAWVTDASASTTSATIPVQNCYQEYIDLGPGGDDDDDDNGNNNSGGIGFAP